MDNFEEGWQAEDFTDVRSLGNVDEEVLNAGHGIWLITSRRNGEFVDKRIPYFDSPDVNERYMARWIRSFKALTKFRPFNYLKQVYPDSDSPNAWGDSCSFHIITEYYPHQSLFDYMDQGNVLDDTQKMVIIYGVAVQLTMMQMAGLVHRSLRPQNIMLDDELYPHVMGLANVLPLGEDGCGEAGMPVTGLLGNSWTDYFMAPEVADVTREKQDVTCMADSWSWAVITYYILTGQRIDNMELSEFWTMADTIVSDLEVPSSIRGLLQDCLSFNPDGRPPPSSICKEIWGGGDDMNLIEGVEMEAIKEYFYSQCVFEDQFFGYWSATGN